MPFSNIRNHRYKRPSSNNKAHTNYTLLQTQKTNIHNKKSCNSLSFQLHVKANISFQEHYKKKNYKRHTHTKQYT